MKKFSNIINETAEIFDPNELEMGIKIESEHGDIYEELETYFARKNIVMPFYKREFYEKIAKAHLREIPDYYTKLSKMENEAPKNI